MNAQYCTANCSALVVFFTWPLAIPSFIYWVASFIPQQVHGAHVGGLQLEEVPQGIGSGQYRIYACLVLDVTAKVLLPAPVETRK